MKFGITANSEIPEAIRVSRQVLSELEGHDIVLESGLAGLFGRPGKPIEDMDIDVLITVGGDGTILRSLQRHRGAHLRRERRSAGLPHRDHRGGPQARDPAPAGRGLLH